MKYKSLYSFLLAILGFLTLSCEKDNLTPQFKAILNENLVVQKDTAQVFQESVINILTDSGFVQMTTSESLSDLIYTEYKDETNELIFKPRFDILDYPDLELFLSEDPILSNDDIKLPFRIELSNQTTTIENLSLTPYLIAYRASAQQVFSVDKFNLIQ